MKKYILCIACLLIGWSLKAQTSIIDDFLKKIPSKEGVTHVNVSKQMLEAIFEKPVKVSRETSLASPEAYGSVSVSKISLDPETAFSDFRKKITSSKYEPYMEINKGANEIIGYYQKKISDSSSEVFVLRQQSEQFSAIYLKGDIEIRHLDVYLRQVRNYLARVGSVDYHDYQPFSFRYNDQVAQFDFDWSGMRQSMEDVMENLKDLKELEGLKELKDLKFNWNQDSIKYGHK